MRMDCHKERLIMRKKRAFSLVEIMVSSIIMSMLLLGVYYFYKNSRIFWSSEHSKLDALHHVRKSMIMIQRDLREAIILPVSPSDPTGYDLKEFSPRKLTFSRYLRFQGVHTEDITYEFMIAGREAKLVRRTNGSIKFDSLLQTNYTEGAGTASKVRYGLLAENPLNPVQKSVFIGIGEEFNPVKYDAQATKQLKNEYLAKHITYSLSKTTGIMISLVIQDVHGNVAVYKSVVYPRTKSFPK